MTRPGSRLNDVDQHAETLRRGENAGAQVKVIFYHDATVFGIADTDETIVRYDLPARGITEGWTVAAVLEQTQAMAEEDWPDVVVAVLSDDAGVGEDFTRVLRKQGVSVLVDEAGADADTDSLPAAVVEAEAEVEVEAEVEAVDEADSVESEITRRNSPPHGNAPTTTGSAPRHGVDAFAAAREGINQRAEHQRANSGGFVQLVARKPRRRRHAKPGWRPSPLQCMLAAGVVIAGLSGWWVVDRYSGYDDNAQGADAVVAQTADSDEQPDTHARITPSEEAKAVEVPHFDEPKTMVHEHSGLRLVTPRGFIIGDSAQPGVFAASGDDPDLRIYVTTDQLHEDPAAEIDVDTVFGDILETVETSSDLQEGRRENEPRQQVHYVENPGDQSRISWTSWVEGNQQLTVGCHSRVAPTPAQKQACELVRESLEKI